MAQHGLNSRMHKPPPAFLCLELFESQELKAEQTCVLGQTECGLEQVLNSGRLGLLVWSNKPNHVGATFFFYSYSSFLLWDCSSQYPAHLPL